MAAARTARTAGVAAVLLTAASGQAVAAGPIEQCVLRWSGHLAGALDPDRLDRLRAICVDVLADEQRLGTMQATAHIYADQTAQAHLLLAMVILITLTGLGLSALQLVASYHLAKAGKGLLAEGGDVTFESGKVAVRSSVVGVVILAISLAFFAIFVSQVYRIKPDQDLSPTFLNGGGGPPPAKAGAGSPPPGTEVPR